MLNNSLKVWERRLSALLASRLLSDATEIGDEVGPKGVITRGVIHTVSRCAVWHSNCYIDQVISFGAQRRDLGLRNDLGSD